MNKYKKSHRTLQAWESILEDEYNRGMLPKELYVKLQAQGMNFPASLERSQTWDVVVDKRPEPPITVPQPKAEEVPAEPYVDEETVALETPQASSTTEEPVEVLSKGASSLDGEHSNAQQDVRGRHDVGGVGKGSESKEEEAWEREGYGICIGCADMYILRCNGDQSPWAEGSDRPEEED